MASKLSKRPTYFEKAVPHKSFLFFPKKAVQKYFILDRFMCCWNSNQCLNILINHIVTDPNKKKPGTPM